jgi:L-lactate dehydrogenase (cytochrome)
VAEIHTIADLRRAARRRLPTMVSEFIEGGAEDELTMQRNRQVFADVGLKPRYLIDVSKRDLTTTILGESVKTPVMLAPTGLMRLAHPEGELGAARAAGLAGAIFAVGAFSSYALEDIASVATGPLWLQLYLWREREVTANLVERARNAGYRALCLTVDTPVIGLRERDLRNGMRIPPKISVTNAIDVARHPRWIYNLARGGPITYGNLLGIAGAQGDTGLTLMDYVNRNLFDPGQTWADLEWLREIWDGPLVIKGITHPQDAERSVAIGVDGIVVSNHGGRQLDGAPATLTAMREILAAVGNSVEVMMDGGIRRGSDVVKAMALGARGCMVGRPYWWGLGANGTAGVSRCLEIFNSEIDRTLALVGRTSVRDLRSEDVTVDRISGQDAEQSYS